MKKLWIIPVLGLMILSLSHCEECTDIYLLAPDQKVYFQFEYINYAWGYQHTGWLLDSSGNIYCYTQPENWHFPDSTGKISKADMESNILAADSLCNEIPQSELCEKIQLIHSASRGKISEPIHEMYDAGATAYYAYTYDPMQKIYKRILLKQTGDFRIENRSRAANILNEWLKGINYDVHNANDIVF